MTTLLLLACAGTPDDTAHTGDSAGEEVDESPSLSASARRVSIPVDGTLALEFTVTDEDPSGVTLSVTLGEDLASGSVDGSTWTATGTTPGATTLTVTATDAGGQTATLELPLEVWKGRTWTGSYILNSPNEDVPGACVAMGLGGFSYVPGYSTMSGTGVMMGIAPNGNDWVRTVGNQTEYGRCASLDPETGKLIYVAESYPASQGVIRAVGQSGDDWEAWAPIPASTAYWVDAHDGLAAVAGTYSDQAAGTRGPWAQLYDAETGALEGEPIFLGAQPLDVRTDPSAVQLLADGTVLVGSWGYWDWEAEAAAANKQSWVQLASPGDVEPERLIELRLDGADVYLTDARQLSDGRIAVVGETTGALIQPLTGASDGFLMVFAPDGTLDWSFQREQAAGSRFVKALEGADGRLYVLGDNGYEGDWVEVLAFEPDGQLAWESTVLEGTGIIGRGMGVAGTDLVISVAFNGHLDDPLLNSEGGFDGFVFRMNTDGTAAN